MLMILPFLLTGILGVTTCQATPAPAVDGLLVWLDASNRESITLQDDQVTAWESRGSVPAEFTASESFAPRLIETSERGPQAAISFDGRNDYLTTKGLHLKLPTFTVVAVIAVKNAAKGAILAGCPAGGNDFDPGFTFDLYGAQNGIDYLSLEGAGRIGGRENQCIGQTPAGVFAVVTLCRDNNEIRMYVDGQAQKPRAINPAETIIDELFVGSRFYTGRVKEFLRGEIAEILVYDHALTDDERKTVETPRIVTASQRKVGEDYGVKMSQKSTDDRMTRPQIVKQWPNITAYEAARAADLELVGPALPVSALPVRKDLLEAIKLCMHCLNSAFDRDKDNEPFFYSNHRADGTGEFHHSLEIGIPHVVGRCLLGNMAASLATGETFPADGLEILTRYLKQSYDNPDQLNRWVDTETGRTGIEFHNMREGLWGLWALLHTKDADWARGQIDRMLETLDRLSDENGKWSLEKMQAAGMQNPVFGVSIPNQSRVVDPLLAVWHETGSELALKLAGQYASLGIDEICDNTGQFTEWQRSSGHVHSITSSLSGIAEYAILAKDTALLDRVRQAMENGIWEYFSSWGWGDEVFPEHPADEILRGETNQTGDVIRTAIHFGNIGEPRFFELAEQFTRGMILPVQHREPELRAFMHDNPEPKSDAERDVILRTVGGSAMQLPNDRMQEGDWPLQTQDITSGMVHSLAEMWNNRVSKTEVGLQWNLLFDYADDTVTLQSGLPLEGHLLFKVNQPVNLRIRIPQWVDFGTLKITCEKSAQPVLIDNSYLVLNNLQAGESGKIEFDIPIRIEKETVDGTVFTTTWAGDQIIDIRPRGTVSPMPF